MKQLIFIMALGVFSLPAFALDPGGLFVEPGVTFEQTSKGKINWPSPLNDSSSQLKGLGLSARLGFHLNQALFLGVDGRYSKPKFKSSVFDSSVSSTAYNWGPVVGMQMPNIGLRLWADYIVDGQVDPESYTAGGSSLDGKFQKGKGYRVGAGFHVLMLSVNLEYQKIKYDEAELQEIGPFAPGTDYSSVSLDDESWILGVSFPLAL